jgi:ubiquitin conjugation factor E4 B
VDSGNRSRTEGFRQVTQVREQEEMRHLQAEGSSTSMTSSSQSSPLKSMASASSSDNVKFPFICECFFMTARVLNLGLIKALSDFKSLVQVSKAILRLADFGE